VTAVGVLGAGALRVEHGAALPARGAASAEEQMTQATQVGHGVTLPARGAQE